MMAELGNLDTMVTDKYVVEDDKSLLSRIRAMFTADLATAGIIGQDATKIVRIMDEGLANVIDHSEDIESGEERGYGEYSIYQDSVEIAFVTYQPKVKKEEAQLMVGASQEGLDRIAVYRGDKKPEDIESMKNLTKDQLKKILYKNRGLGLAMMELLSGNEPKGNYLKDGSFNLIVKMYLESPVSKPEN